MRGERGDSSELTPEYKAGRAEDCYTGGKLEAVLACGEKVRPPDPRPRSAAMGRAFILILLEKPHNIVSLHCRGAALESLERWDEAPESYNAALKGAPDFAVSRERKAMLEKTKGVRDPGQGDRNG